jgi:hypothetical protein
MHGDDYLNKRFSDEYLKELAELFIWFFLAVVIALIVGIITGEVRIENPEESPSTGTGMATPHRADCEVRPEEKNQRRAQDPGIADSAAEPHSSGFGSEAKNNKS